MTAQHVAGSPSTESAPNTDRIMYRSGAAARLAGLSPETLRVWERRYKLTEAARSARGQRLYSALQVQRLGVIKQLVDQGHAIGALANLTTQEMLAMRSAALASTLIEGSLNIGVVGSLLSRRISASGRDTVDLAIRQQWPNLAQAVASPELPDRGLEVLFIEQSEFDESALEDIKTFRKRCANPPTVILYRFCSSATIRALRAQGCMAVRIPADMGELPLIARAAISGERTPARPLTSVSSPRFDEQFLSSITSKGTQIACECPKHLAELLMMVGSFERYSARCAHRNAEDEHLHSELATAAGQARALLESAMERLARAEGIEVPPPYQTDPR
ncbi:MerR family transcriptional regulator [Orrella marina]|nr:MerR family transcriptional regulator [Orrella marina]